MVKKISVLFLAISLCVLGISFAVEAKKPVPGPKRAMMAENRPNMNMIAGTIESIDASDTANVKINIKEDSGKSRTIFAGPWTNITKIADVSELKSGDSVRVMTRNAPDKEMAMGILFGKIKNMPPLKPAAPLKKDKK